MLQRPQTLLLITAVALLVTSLFLPIWQINTQHLNFTLTAFNSTSTLSGQEPNSRNLVYMGFLVVFAIIGGIYTITKYNNRSLQMKLCSVVNLLIGAHLILFMMMVIPAAQKEVQLEGSISWGFFLPIGAFVLNLIAKLFIRKDDNLIKSVDRIR